MRLGAGTTLIQLIGLAFTPNNVVVTLLETCIKTTSYSILKSKLCWMLCFLLLMDTITSFLNTRFKFLHVLLQFSHIQSDLNSNNCKNNQNDMSEFDYKHCHL